MTIRQLLNHTSGIPDYSQTPDLGKELLADRDRRWSSTEVIALIAQGLSNQEIAARAFLSIISVKTDIRSAYRKIGVERRTQAVLWATQNGFVPTRARLILGDP